MYSQITIHLETHHASSTHLSMRLSVRKVNGHCFAGNHSHLNPVYGHKKESWSSFFFFFFSIYKRLWTLYCTMPCFSIYKKAFDSVLHHALLNKLRDLLNEFILKWICDCLTHTEKVESGSQWPDIWNSSSVVWCASGFCDWTPAIPHLHGWGNECSLVTGKPNNCICW